MAIWDDAAGWTKNALSNTGDALFGNSSKPGVFGTGQQKFNPYQIDPNAANTANGQQVQQQAQQRLASVDARQAPTMQAAQVGPTQSVRAQQIGAAQNVQAAQLDSRNASTMQGATIARGEDQQARGMQSTLNQQLAEQASGRGPSLATMQLQDAQDRNAKQAMSLAASMPGQGNSALAARQAMNSTAQSNQQAARDAAQMRVQEQQGARAQLAQNLGTTRAQDIGVNTSQAQLSQDASAQNMGAQNQFALQGAGFQQQANLANQAAQNARQSEQAQLDFNRMQFNASQGNTMNLSQAQLQQQANQSNLQSRLQNQQQQDAMAQYYFGANLGMDQADRNAAMQMQGLQANQSMGVMGLDRGAYEDAARRQSNAMGGVINGASGLLGALSDENQKTNIQKLSDADLDEMIYGVGSGMKAPAPAAPQQPESMQSALGKAGKAGGGANPLSLVGGIGGGVIGGLSTALSNSPLGDVLHTGSSPMSGPMDNPTGDMKLNRDASLDVNGSIKQISQSTVTDPMRHPGAMASGGGGIGIGPFRLSDENQKDHVSNASDKTIASDFRKLTPYEYEYKDPNMPGAAPGKQVSPMAQDLEQTRLFKGAVSEDEDGNKHVDYARAFGGMLAGMAMTNRRLDKLEKRKG